MASPTQIVPVRAPEQATSRPAADNFRISLGTDSAGNVRGLTDDQVIEQVRRLRQESIDRNDRISRISDECWAQYRNEQDFSDKASWQSRVTLAKGHAAVKHFTANILRLMTQAEQWVTVEDILAPEGQPSFAPHVEKGVLKLFELADGKEILRDALEYSAAAMFGAVKVIWQFTETNHTTIEQGEQGLQLRNRVLAEGGLGVYSIDPWKLHFGPRTQGGAATDYIVEDSDADIADLLDLGGFENLEGFIDRDQKESGKDDPNSQARRNTVESSNESRVRRRIQLWDFWGDIIDPQTQRTVLADAHIIVANDEKIIKFQENPLWDRKPPYILFSPLIVAGRFPGGGILEMNLEVKRAIDRIAQMWEDHLLFSVLPMWEAELGALENPEDVGTGVYPGKIFRKKMGQGANQIFRPLDVRPMTAESFNVALGLDKEYQRGTFITEQTQGLIDAKGETTATEIQQTALASTLILSDIALHLEYECLAPLGEMIWDRMFQFMDVQSVPSWTQIVGGQLGQFLDMLPMELRLETVRGKYTFKSRGLSRVIERQQQRNGLLQYIQTAGLIPPMSVILNWPEIARRLHESFHLPERDKLLVPNWQAILQQWQLGALAQANPLAQQQMKQESTMEQISSETDQVVAQESVKAQASIVREIVKGEIARQQAESKERIAAKKSKEKS